MTPKSLERFTKLMMLTSSDQDGEALSALRMANAILLRDNLNWEEFIERGIKIKHERSQRPPPPHEKPRPSEEVPDHLPDSATIESALQHCIDRLFPGSFRDLILSINDQWEAQGRMTLRQWQVVYKAAIHRHWSPPE